MINRKLMSIFFFMYEVAFSEYLSQVPNGYND